METGFIEGRGRAAEDFVRQFTGWFTVDGFGGFLFLAILGTSLVILTFTIAWLWRARKELRRAVLAVRTARGSSEAERQKAFVEHFDAISERLNDLKRIGPCWREFSETLDRPDAGAPEGAPGYGMAVRNERRPQDYLTLGNADMTAPVLRSLPGVLIGVGLFLTFVGGPPGRPPSARSNAVTRR